MDGVRAYWDGSQLLSRKGKPIMCPSWFTRGLPSHSKLDGELWMGQGTTVENVVTVLKSKKGDWSNLRYYIYDTPETQGSYEERMEQIIQYTEHLVPHIQVINNIECRDLKHLHEYLDAVVKSKGEGVMLRAPGTLFAPGYTQSLLKVKVGTVKYLYG